MSSVVDGIANIVESILSLPLTIVEGIIDGIKSIFIPDTEVIQATFDNTVENIQTRFGIVGWTIKEDLENITEQPVQDITGNYKINGLGTLKLKFFDTKYFKVGVEYFRPLLRGFIVLMLLFFNYKHVLSFIGQEAGILGRVVQDDSKKGGGKE